MASLTVNKGTNLGQRLKLEGAEEFILGRSPDCQVTIEDPLEFIIAQFRKCIYLFVLDRPSACPAHLHVMFRLRLIHPRDFEHQPAVIETGRFWRRCGFGCLCTSQCGTV